MAYVISGLPQSSPLHVASLSCRPSSRRHPNLGPHYRKLRTQVITFSPLQSDQLQESILISLPSHSYSPRHLREAPSTPPPPSTAPPPMPPKLQSPTGGHTNISHGGYGQGGVDSGHWAATPPPPHPASQRRAQSPALQRTSAPPWTIHTGTAWSPCSLRPQQTDDIQNQTLAKNQTLVG